ncbi:acyl-CoA thioesterase, partial [Bacteroidota bacterium]
SHRGQARFEDILSNGLVNPNRMFYWIEWARAQYFHDIGLEIDPDSFVQEYLHMIVHTEVDFFGQLRFFDKYEVLSRIVYVKNSSVCMHQIIRNSKGEIIVYMSVIMVFVDYRTTTSKPIPEDLRKMINDWENIT